MPRTSKISHISQRDTEAFRMLFNLNHVPRQYLNVTNNRLHTYESSGLIQRIFTTKNEELIKCTAKGRDYISKQSEFWNRTPYVSAFAPKHNARLASVYASLTKEEQAGWITEKEVARLYEERLDYIREHDHDRWEQLREQQWSPPDAAVVNTTTGEIEMLIEVTTGNYGEAELEMKLCCSQVLDTEISFYKA